MASLKREAYGKGVELVVLYDSLIDFFAQSRMLHPIDLWVDDYTCAPMTITPADIAANKVVEGNINATVKETIYWSTILHGRMPLYLKRISTTNL